MDHRYTDTERDTPARQPEHDSGEQARAPLPRRIADVTQDVTRDVTRRLRLGPSAGATGPWSPMPELSPVREDITPEDEGRTIARVLHQHSVLSADRLNMLVGARAWGPGRFHQALAYALQRRWIRNSGHGTFSPGPRIAEVLDAPPAEQRDGGR